MRRTIRALPEGAVRLSEWRSELGVTQPEAALILGIATITYVRYETGARRVPRPILLLVDLGAGKERGKEKR